MNDYAQDTEHLSLAENGAYDRLLNYYYQKMRPLPLDETVLFRVCRAFTPEEQAAVRNIITQFFTEEPDGYHQKRADLEIAKLKQKSQTNSKNARARHGRTEAANSEGRAEGEKAEGERGEFDDSMRPQSERIYERDTNAPATAERTDIRSHLQIRDQNTDLTNQSSEIRDHKKPAAVSRADEPRGGSRRKFCDDDFIAELQASDAYKMLNVRLIYNRMLVWCNRNKKPASQNRLIGWLNREDVPMGNGNGSYQNGPGQQGNSGSSYEFKSRTVIS